LIECGSECCRSVVAIRHLNSRERRRRSLINERGGAVARPGERPEEPRAADVRESLAVIAASDEAGEVRGAVRSRSGGTQRAAALGEPQRRKDRKEGASATD